MSKRKRNEEDTNKSDIESIETIPTQPEGEANIFREVYGLWEIVFNGKESFLGIGYKGLYYIHYLIKISPDKIDALSLANFNEKSDKMKVLNQCEDGELTVLSAFREQEILDPDTKKEYKKRLEEIEEELEEANKNNDIGKDETLEEEKQKILDELKKATTIKGKHRPFSDDQEKARKMITEAIRRFLKVIEKRDKNLYNHFKESIKTGNMFCYIPAQPTNWILS